MSLYLCLRRGFQDIMRFLLKIFPLELASFGEDFFRFEIWMEESEVRTMLLLLDLHIIISTVYVRLVVGVGSYSKSANVFFSSVVVYSRSAQQYRSSQHTYSSTHRPCDVFCRPPRP